MLAPICLFVYNRLEHTIACINALKNNNLAKESELFIFSDYAKNEKDILDVNRVRMYLENIDGFKKVNIIMREKNFGLANNIIDGVTKIVNEYGKIIVLEDDLVTSSDFLKYMNDGLELYADEEKVASIHGYVYPLPHYERLTETFFIRGADCWGWATWARAWKHFEPDGKKLLKELKRQHLSKKFNFNNSYPYVNMLEDQIKGRNNSWAIRWYASAFINNMYTLYPRQSLVQNIGMDNSGTHCGYNDYFNNELIKYINLNKQSVIESEIAKNEFIYYFKRLRFLSRKQKLINFFNKIIRK